VLHLGVGDGGTTAFWVEMLGLTHFLGLDRQTRGDSPYYQRWHANRGADVARTHWGVGLTDPGVLDTIITEGRYEPFDLIFDDGSREFEETLRSFELLFNRLRPGGYYVIENWAWALAPAVQDRQHPEYDRAGLHTLVHRLADLHGGRPDLIASIKLYPDFVAVERGDHVADPLDVTALTPQRATPWREAARKSFRGIRSR
jgi:hypothetical protein